MVKILALFWIKRFCFAALPVFILLLCVELYKSGMTSPNWIEAIFWGLSSGVIAATISTYSVYKVQCKLVFKGE